MTGAPPLPAQAGNGVEHMAPGTSIFDPVLCELVYRWFCPPGGMILDPFAGGSVRGIVAAALGRPYVGIELRPEQVHANRAQWQEIGGRVASVASAPPRLAPSPPRATPAATISDPSVVTPIEQRGAYWFKRDDLYDVDGANGGKVRGAIRIAEAAKATGLIACGSRPSTMLSRVAVVARALGLPCRVHTASGADTEQMRIAHAAGAVVVQHAPGYLTVLKKRAAEDAEASGWTLIPWGLEHPINVEQTRAQVPASLPAGVTRIVVPVGGGMTLAGVLWGLLDRGIAVPVLGVQIGGEVEKRLDAHAPPAWRSMVTLVPSGLPYETEATVTTIEGVFLDPVYEAKCIRFMVPGDLLWIVGCRAAPAPTPTPTPAAPRPPASAAPGSIGIAADAPHPRWIHGDSRDLATLAADVTADLVFSCPPYADLERYSDDPQDLSTLDYPAFLSAYRAIVAASVARLRDDRFAVFVVGDVRDPVGFYRNFPGDTITAFLDAGMKLYNEAVLVTAVGSLPLRVGRSFGGYRKLGKTHQNVLVFYKGNPKKIASAFGTVEVELPIGEGETS